jgi:iron complex transport system substrate-binding protein
MHHLAVRRSLTLSLAVTALVLTACGQGASTADTATEADATTDPTTASDAFPVTIEHALGTTEIPEEPTKVATWGWGASEAVLALGVVPIAMAEQIYGATDGVLPWTAEHLVELDVATPTLLSDGDAPPYEEIAAVDPDVILAPYSGITAEQYELLEQIAPTVAYPDAPWTTPWREVIEVVGESLGRSEQAADVLADIDATLAEQAAAHPQFAGKTLAAVWDAAGTFYVYKPADARVDFMLDLGFVSAPAVDELATGEESFYYTLSYEQLDRLESDVLVSYHDTPAEAEQFLQAKRTSLLPAVQRGAVAQVVGTEFIAAVSPPTALSLTWGLEDLVASLDTAVQAAQGAR